MAELQWIHVAGPCADGVMCEQGAHVADWTPEQHAPVLFLSGVSRMEPGEPIRGGIPVVFPWFGDDPDGRGRPAHGFARRVPWRVVETLETGDAVRVALSLEDDAQTRAMWPHRFALRLDATFGEELEVALRVENRDAEAFRFEAALHTYLAVGDVREALVRGLEGATYVDKLDAGARKVQDGPIGFTGETDRVYVGTEADCIVEDPVLARRIRVAKQGARSTIVWNPWIEKAARMPDFGDDEWIAMVCVESGNVADDAVELAPGASHTLRIRVTVE